jgi:hypothetical protein
MRLIAQTTAARCFSILSIYRVMSVPLAGDLMAPTPHLHLNHGLCRVAALRVNEGQGYVTLGSRTLSYPLNRSRREVAEGSIEFQGQIVFVCNIEGRL